MKTKTKVMSITAFAIMLLMPLTVQSALACGGKITGGGQCIVEDQTTEIPSASFGFNVMAPLVLDKADLEVKGELNYVDHTTGLHLHAHDMVYVSVWTDEPGNKPWPFLEGDFHGPCTVNGETGHYFYVYIQDKGEPGKADTFYIELDGNYLGGSKDVPILAGNIQIHKPPK